MERYCNKCDKDRPISDFGVNNARKDGLSRYCKPCMREYRKSHYQKNKVAYIDRAKATRGALHEVLKEYKSKPCMDCGAAYPAFVMDLDHRPGEVKLFDPSTGIKRGSLVALQAEMEKCDVVCSNCHRIRTHERLVA